MAAAIAATAATVLTGEGRVQVFEGEWDDEGVYFYQAFRDSIADYALEHQRFGGQDFSPTRMTWIKPSFAWMLYRAGYGRKHGQMRILKIKLAHEAVAHILSHCTCIEAGFRGGGGECVDGRVQWDPARDLMSPDPKKDEPRKMLSTRAIQIGVARSLSEYYVQHTLRIQEVSALARAVGAAHKAHRKKPKALTEAMEALGLPAERPYMPLCKDAVLLRLGMLPGAGAAALGHIGRGMVDFAPPARGPPPRSVSAADGDADGVGGGGGCGEDVGASGADAGGADAGGADAGAAVALAQEAAEPSSPAAATDGGSTTGPQLLAGGSCH
jgi:hypothetical protein